MESQKLLLQILKCILNGQRLSECHIVPEDWQGLLQAARQHNVVSMLGCALPLLSEQQMPDHEELDILQKQSMATALINSNQLYELGRLQAAFEQQGIWNMPLKGCNTRLLYPQPDMRTMNDLDILCKPGQQGKIRKVMSMLNYDEVQPGRKHDVYKKGPFIRIEMHREMVAARSPFSAYYKNVWDQSIKKSGYEYACKLSTTDEFVYNLVHLAGHLEEGGIGIRFITDVYVFDSCNAVDHNQLREKLETIGLWQLYCNISCLAQQWFSLQPPVLQPQQLQLMQRLETFVLTGGLFGSTENSGALLVQKEGRVRSFLNACFPSYKEMCSLFPWLNGWQILLPLAWFLRGMRSLLYRRENIRHQWNKSIAGDVQRGEKIRTLYKDIGYDR